MINTKPWPSYLTPNLEVTNNLWRGHLTNQKRHKELPGNCWFKDIILMLFLFQQSQFSILPWCFQQVGLGCWFLFPPRNFLDSPTTNNTSQIPKKHHPRYLLGKPLIHQPTKKKQRKKQGQHNPSSTPVRSTFPFPPRGKPAAPTAVLTNDIDKESITCPR